MTDQTRSGKFRAEAGYSSEELIAIYELGRLYFEMGYFAPAERIFSGLLSIDPNMTPARLGLGLLKLELGLYQDATAHFRQALQNNVYEAQSKLGLCAAFLATGEKARAASLLAEVGKATDAGQPLDSETKRLFDAFVVRCQT